MRPALGAVLVAAVTALFALAGCGGDDEADDTNTPTEAGAPSTGPEAFAAEEQAVRAYLGEQDREPQAIICSARGENATCVVTFEEGTCEHFDVESGARTVVTPAEWRTECPEGGSG